MTTDSSRFTISDSVSGVGVGTLYTGACSALGFSPLQLLRLSVREEEPEMRHGGGGFSHWLVNGGVGTHTQAGWLRSLLINTCWLIRILRSYKSGESLPILGSSAGRDGGREGLMISMFP